MGSVQVPGQYTTAGLVTALKRFVKLAKNIQLSITFGASWTLGRPVEGPMEQQGNRCLLVAMGGEEPAIKIVASRDDVGGVEDQSTR